MDKKIKKIISLNKNEGKKLGSLMKADKKQDKKIIKLEHEKKK